jgi:hypothetical protein
MSNGNLLLEPIDSDPLTSIRIDIDNLKTNITHSRAIDDLQKTIVDKENQHNLYSSTKSVGQNFLNLGIITGYIQILVDIVGRNPSVSTLGGFDLTLIVLISLSMVNQVVIFVFVSMLYASSTEQVTKNLSATTLNNLVTCLTAISLIGNIAIATIAAKTPSSVQTLSNSTTTG